MPGMGINFSAEMDDAAIREFRHLQKAFPAEMKRVLAALGYILRREIRADIRQGGPDGHKWPKLSAPQIYQRFGRLHRGMDAWNPQMTLKKMSKKQWRAMYSHQPYRMADARHSWKGSTSKGTLRSNRPFGRILGGIRYKVRGNDSVSIGAITGRFDKYLAAAQEGAALGPGGSPGSRVITPKMRRFFWVARVPLGKGKSRTQGVKRPLIRPVFEQYKGAIRRFVQLRVEALVLGPYEPRDVTFKKAGFHDVNG